jgi:hypothetical protein
MSKRADGQANCGDEHVEPLQFSHFDVLHLKYLLVLRKCSPRVTRRPGLNLMHTFVEMFLSV